MCVYDKSCIFAGRFEHVSECLIVRKKDNPTNKKQKGRIKGKNLIIVMKRTLLLTICLILTGGLIIANTVTAPADIPNYYSSIDGTSGKTLYDAISTVTKHGYSSLGYDGLYTAYKSTDLKSDGTIWDMYSNCEFSNPGDKCGNYKVECDCFNREHSIPQSWWGGGTSGIGCDIFHVLPTDGKVNGMRSNYAYGEVSNASYTSKNGSKLGSAKSLSVSGKTIVGNSGITATLSDKVFEPIDEYKGDFARGYMGALIKWGTNLSNFPQDNGTKVFSGTYTAAGYFGLTKYGVALLLKWHRQDPVSQKEIDRNNGIQKTQGNRNPFIDYPYLAEFIWGSHAGEELNLNQLLNSSDSRFIPGESDGYLGEIVTPTIDISTSEIAFGGVAPGETATQTLTIKGTLLSSDISLSLTGTNANLFTVTPTTVAAANANITNTITVTYKPTTKGIFSATLHVSSGILSQDITLSGSCEEICTVRWMVNEKNYTIGNPTATTVVNTRVTTLPTAPASCNSESEQFVGWTETEIKVAQEEVPDDLFSTEEEAPIVTQNTTYHAVFAHLEQSGTAAQTLLWTPDDNTGWTMSGLSSKTDYEVMLSGAYIESPEITLNGLDSVKVMMRTYGGTSYKTLTMSSNGNVIGTIDAEKGKNMTQYLWVNTKTLTGQGALKFYSTTSTDDTGPGIQSITIYLHGTTYTYSRYITTCESTPTDIVDDPSKPMVAEKILYNGQLLIRYDRAVYNMYGQRVSYE